MDKTLAWVMAGIGVAAILIGRKLTGMVNEQSLIEVLRVFIPSVEGFLSHPKWDVNRWTWGYGTEAPGSTGTITRDQAFADMVAYLLSDYRYLRPKIKRPLNANQWSALLSFSYNLGSDDAVRLIPYIETYDDDELGRHWRLYVYADGKVDAGLVDRRQREWELFNS